MDEVENNVFDLFEEKTLINISSLYSIKTSNKNCILQIIVTP